MNLVPQYLPAADRYEQMPYRRCGRSGLLLPAITLGLWQNFGSSRPLEHSRAILRRAFDRVSPTSISRTTTARRTAAPRRTSAD